MCQGGVDRSLRTSACDAGRRTAQSPPGARCAGAGERGALGAIMDITELVGAIRESLNTEDAFRGRLNFEQWRVLSQYLTQHELRGGDMLIRQGDRRPHDVLPRAAAACRCSPSGGGGTGWTVLRPGSLVGETMLFLDGPHTVSVEAMTPCGVWALRAPRFEELAQRVPGGGTRDRPRRRLRDGGGRAAGRHSPQDHGAGRLRAPLASARAACLRPGRAVRAGRREHQRVAGRRPVIRSGRETALEARRTETPGRRPPQGLLGQGLAYRRRSPAG